MDVFGGPLFYLPHLLYTLPLGCPHVANISGIGIETLLGLNF